jgi:hypothetical protein
VEQVSIGVDLFFVSSCHENMLGCGFEGGKEKALTMEAKITQGFCFLLLV